MAEEDQLLRYVREDFYRTELIPNVDGGGNMQYYFDAFRETDQSSSLRSLGVPERSASPSCTEQVALENYLPGGFFTSNSLDQFGDVRIAAFEPPAAAIECSNSTKLEVGAAAAPKLLAGDHHHHNSGNFLTGSQGLLTSQRVHQILFEDHPQDHIEGGQPPNLDIHPSRINSVASTSDCKSTSNTAVDIEVQAACREFKPKTWRGCSPSTLMLQLQGAPASSAAAVPSASKFSNFDHRPKNMNINFDRQPINIITSTSNNTQSATQQQQQQLSHMPSMNAPSRPNPLYTQPRVSINPLNHSYSNADRDSSFQPQSMCTKGAGDHNNINTSMTMSWATHLPDHQQQTRLRGATESCHHPGPRGAATSSECEVNADQSFTANSHVTLAGSSWPHGRTGACSQVKLAWVDNSSGNNSWSSCTSPSPSSNDQNEEAVGPINITSWTDSMLDMKLPSHLHNFPAYVVSELERTRKKVKGTVSTHHHMGGGGGGSGITTSEDGLILPAGNNLGDQHHHQKRKRPRSLKEKILQLILQTDPHSSKVINYNSSDLLGPRTSSDLGPPRTSDLFHQPLLSTFPDACRGNRAVQFLVLPFPFLNT